MSNIIADYSSEYAFLYDLITGHKDYRTESKRLYDHLKVEKKTIHLLSIGCGTGSHELHLEDYGCNVVGIDISLPMIEIAQTKPFKRSVFAASSIENYSKSNFQKFDVIISLFNVVNCLPDINSLVEFFESAAIALKPNGVIFLESWNMIPCILVPPEVVTRKFVDPEGRYDLERTAVPKLDSSMQSLMINYTISGEYAGKEINLNSTHNLTLFSKIEYEYALKKAGFRDISFDPSLADMNDGKLNLDRFRMISITANKLSA